MAAFPFGTPLAVGRCGGHLQSGVLAARHRGDGACQCLADPQPRVSDVATGLPVFASARKEQPGRRRSWRGAGGGREPRGRAERGGELGERGDTVFVKKSFGRNRLLPQGLAVYASLENKASFKQECRLFREGETEERMQTQSGEKMVEFLRGLRLTVRMKNNVSWELSKDIVCRHFLKELQVFVPPDALRIPDEPITRWGEHWCEVTVNGIDTVRVPMSVVNFERPKTRRYKEWLKHQQQREQEGLAADKEGESEESR
ncbi:large ribosomal subunit protein bL9m isoform X2 [Narcine bancroftii]|uniref:large ribosomal subunit protein bL9m isoform X2 n=1 Tax=Narcine bancroftii TaxID=1343680 RepID=UPI0038315847